MVFKSLGADLFNLSKNYKTINVLSQENSNHLQVLINDLNDLKDTGNITTETLNGILNSTDSISNNGNLTNYFKSVAEGAENARVNIVDAYAAILDGNTHGLKNVQSIMNTYNKSFEGNVKGQQDFAKAVGQSNSALSGYLTTVGENGTASLKGYAGHLVKTTAKTVGLQVATTALNAAISIGLSAAISGLVMIISEAVNSQEEMRQQIKDTSDKTKELTDNIYSLYQAYADMKIGVDNGTESKENLTTATDNLLDVLGYEGEAVDDLIAKYGNLSDAINQATADKLRESLPDLADAVNVELEEAVKEATAHDDKLHWGFDITADDSQNKGLMDFIKEYNKQNGGVNFETVNSLTTRIDFEGGRASAEGIKQRIENMQKLRQALFDEYGAENVQSLDFYTKLSDRISELTTAYDEYTVAYGNYNNTVAQAEIIQSLIGKEIPKTVDEYKAYRQELIKSAENSGQFIGTQEDIINAIDGTISKMNEFSDIRNQTANRDTAYDLFGIDDIVNDANEGMKKAFINTLSPEDLKIATQIPDLFAEGLDGAAKKIEKFKKDNPISLDVDTLSLEELKEKYEELTKSVSDYTSNQKTLNDALDEQKEHGQLSASTIQSLTEAGYAQALAIDAETGAVTLNMKMVEELNKQKLLSIKLDARKQKADLTQQLEEEKKKYEELKSKLQSVNEEKKEGYVTDMLAAGANIKYIEAQLAAVDALSNSTSAPDFGNSDNEELIDVTNFKKALAEKEHLLAMEQITEEEFYTWLDSESERVYGSLTDYQDELWKHEEEIYKWRKDKRQEEIDSEKEYIESLKDEYSEMIDSRIDEQEKLAESIEKSYDDKISAIDKQIDAINKVSEAEERHKDILDAEKSVMEAQKKLQEASIKNRLTYVGNGAWEARQDTDAIEEAKSELEDAKNERDKAYQENHISALEEQKELLETQKDNASEYYDNVVKDLEQQKTDREKMYDTLVNIYDEISGEKKQTTSNTDLVKKLTDGGDISKAVHGLSPTELQQAFKSGILTTDSNGNYTVDYSVLDNNTSSVAENTTALNNINDTLNKIVPETTSTNDKSNFGGYGSINNLVKAIQSGEFKYSSAVASQMFNNNVQSRIGQGLTKMPEYVNNVFNNDLKPEFNCTFNIEGSMDRKTMDEVEHRLDSKFIEYTQKLTNAITTSYNKQMSKI